MHKKKTWKDITNSSSWLYTQDVKQALPVFGEAVQVLNNSPSFTMSSLEVSHSPSPLSTSDTHKTAKTPYPVSLGLLIAQQKCFSEHFYLIN